MRRIKYTYGEYYGANFRFIKEVTSISKWRRRALWECSCGTYFNADISNIINFRQEGCGCLNGKGNITHGLSKNKYYKRWINMMQRCYNKEHRSYSFYGGRGIYVSNDFKNAKNYIEYVSSLLNSGVDGYSIDRINNNKGYEKGNLSWATKTAQAINTRVRVDNSSGYKGVNIGWKNKWRSIIFTEGKQYNLGSYSTIEEALIVRNNFIIKNNLKHKIQ